MLKLSDSLNFWDTWAYLDRIHLGTKPHEDAEKIGMLCLNVVANTVQFGGYTDKRKPDEQ